MREEYMSFNKNVPSSALKFYVKLYNAKNNVPQMNIKEAMKSWVRLHPKDKQFISNKYNQYCQTQKNHHLEYLKSMEPYLKKKKPYKQTENTFQDLSLNEQHEVPIVEAPQDQSNQLRKQNVEYNSITEQHPESHVMIEPVPPTFNNAKDLFNMMQPIERELEDMTWSSLPAVKKRRFQTAATMLKKDYIDNYILYLKSLPSLELYKILKNTEQLNDDS